MKIDCTVYDRCEGKLHITVHVSEDDAAYEEADIAAAELGCRNIQEIVVGVFE